MSYLPPELQPYAPIIGIVLIFVDGLIIGVAIKKAAVGAILLIAGLLLAGFVGLTIPFSTGDVWTHILNILASQASHVGAVIYGLPIFWLIGFAIGIWKG